MDGFPSLIFILRGFLLWIKSWLNNDKKLCVLEKDIKFCVLDKNPKVLHKAIA
jgi:hypothetical protein